MALRDGFTTGTVATAAAMAALRVMLGDERPDYVDAPLPPFAGRALKIGVEKSGSRAFPFAEVRKDGGDDPDATSGMIIRAEIRPGLRPGTEIAGGEGIGRITKPGLALAPGEFAINPVPRQQIAAGLRAAGAGDLPLRVIVSAPEGEDRAKRTLNAKLGIIGGISILGTRGIVKPYSHAAYRASIKAAINVAKAAGITHILLATGRRSAALLAQASPGAPECAAITIGDHIQAALALAHPFQKITLGCFFGKLVKLAQGYGYTHASASALDTRFLAEIAGMPELENMNTARQALEGMGEASGGLVAQVATLAARNAAKFAGRRVIIHLFHADGGTLALV